MQESKAIIEQNRLRRASRIHWLADTHPELVHALDDWQVAIIARSKSTSFAVTQEAERSCALAWDRVEDYLLGNLNDGEAT